MKTKPDTIVVPHVKHPSDTTGLQFRNGSWHVRWTRNGKVKTRSASTTDVEFAKKFRELKYAQLVERGATVAVRSRSYEKPVTVEQRKPFVLMRGAKVIGEFDTAEQAERAKNRETKKAKA